MTEWNAAEYAHGASLQAAMAAEVLARVRFEGGERVLDVGCGDGHVTAEIAARVPRGSVVGIDPSHAMIDYAAKRFPPSAHANLRFEVGDARTLGFRAAFDRVVSFNALHWVPEQARALRAIRGALVEAGRADLRLVCDGPRASVETVAERTGRSPRYAAHFATASDPYLHVTPDRYAALATAAGFRVVAQDVADKAWDFGSRAAFRAFCAMGMRAWTERLPAALADPFIDEVVDGYLRAIDAPPAEAGVFRFYQMDLALDVAPA